MKVERVRTLRTASTEDPRSFARQTVDEVLGLAGVDRLKVRHCAFAIVVVPPALSQAVVPCMVRV